MFLAKSMQINLTAIVKAIPERTEEMKAVLVALAVESKKEAAAIQYDLHQSATEPNVFIFHEIWQDKERLDMHNATPHVSEFISKSAPLLAEPLSIYFTDRIL